MELGVIFLFLLVYLGIVLGNVPGLALDRTGIALLGAIVLIALKDIPLPHVAQYVDFPSLAILFSFMILSAQFYYSGFYTRLVERMQSFKLTPSRLLLAVILVSGALSAVLINDIVCLALAPLIARGCLKKRLDPAPFLIALACASNIGSGLTLIGNPQNLLIGSVLSIPFAGYLKYSLVPCLLGLGVTWFVIKGQMKKGGQRASSADFEEIPFDFWQSAKGVFILLFLLILFFFFDLPREKVSLVLAGCLLLSRRMASQTMLSFIDWQLLVLFTGLFVVNGVFLEAGAMERLTLFLQDKGIDLHLPAWVFAFSSVLSNVVSNVPAVMLLLPFAKTPFAGSLPALSSTLAGNLFIVGSIANIIVIAQAARFGIRISWKKHLRAGLPIALITLILAAAWLSLVRNF